MKLSDIITLLGAGYTRAEIDAMEKTEATQAQPPEQEPKQEAQPEQEPKQEAQPEPKQVSDASNKELLDAIQKLTAAVQLKNVQTVAQEAVASQNSAEEAEKVLLNLYNT